MMCSIPMRQYYGCLDPVSAIDTNRPMELKGYVESVVVGPRRPRGSNRWRHHTRSESTPEEITVPAGSRNPLIAILA